MSEPQVKGMAVLNAQRWFDEGLGAGWFLATAREHDPSFPERLLPGSWYSVRTTYFVYQRAFEVLEGYASFREMMQAAVATIAVANLNGILRAFLWVASPKMFLRTTPKIWATYVNFSTLEVLRNDAGHFEARISEIPADVREWVAGACAGFVPAALELVGAEQAQASIRDLRPTPGADTWELVCEARYS